MSISVIPTLTLTSASCDNALDKPWHKESYWYRHYSQIGVNIVDTKKTVPAEQMNNFICKPQAYELMQEGDRISCHERLKACEKKSTAKID